MEQRCTILNLYLNWLLYLGGATFFLVTGRYLFFFVWVLGTPLVQIAYVRLFPRLSKALGRTIDLWAPRTGEVTFSMHMRCNGLKRRAVWRRLDSIFAKGYDGTCGQFLGPRARDWLVAHHDAAAQTANANQRRGL